MSFLIIIPPSDIFQKMIWRDITPIIRPFGGCTGLGLTLMLLVAIFTTQNDAKKLKKTETLACGLYSSEITLMNTKLTGLSGSPNSLPPCALGESSFSIRRVKAEAFMFS